MRRKTMRRYGFPDYAEPKLRRPRRLCERTPWMGTLKCCLVQESILRWWNQNIRPGKYKRFNNA